MKKLYKILKTGIKTSKKFLKTAGWLSIITGTLAIANYERTHSDLEVITNQDGTHTYKHEDDRTTHLLNILAGKEKFTKDDFLIEERGRISRRLERKNIKLDKSLDNMSIEELDEVVTKYIYNDSARGNYSKFFYEEFEDINKIDTIKQKSNKDIYELVWQLEKECGNPKIRLLDDPGFLTPPASRGQHFIPIGNTIYITLRDLSDFIKVNRTVLIGEMAHAKQFKEKPWAMSIQALLDWISNVKRVAINLSPLSIEHEKSYAKSGSVEHEAHKIIEPYLEKKYPLFIKK